jgi:hypothetical protein
MEQARKRFLPSIGRSLCICHSIALILHFLDPFSDGRPEDEHQQQRDRDDKGECTNQIKGKTQVSCFHYTEQAGKS